MERLVGRKAPDFKMNSVLGDGSEFKEVKLSDYNGKWLVMFFLSIRFYFRMPNRNYRF